MKKQVLTVALVATFIGAGLVSTGKIFAETAKTTGPMSSIIERIAAKFGLDTNDVQEVFEEERDERQKERQVQFETRLTQLVTNGKITEAQKQLILAKHQEMVAKRQTEMQSLQGLTGEERRAAMSEKRTQREAERASLEAWANEQGIDIQYLMGEFGMHGGRGMRGGINNDGI